MILLTLDRPISNTVLESVTCLGLKQSRENGGLFDIHISLFCSNRLIKANYKICKHVNVRSIIIRKFLESLCAFSPPRYEKGMRSRINLPTIQEEPASDMTSLGLL